ncbi:hypothetical protein DSECCO2_453970 [anaerobic digester metagenome]
MPWGRGPAMGRFCLRQHRHARELGDLRGGPIGPRIILRCSIGISRNEPEDKVVVTDNQPVAGGAVDLPSHDGCGHAWRLRRKRAFARLKHHRQRGMGGDDHARFPHREEYRARDVRQLPAERSIKRYQLHHQHMLQGNDRGRQSLPVQRGRLR